MNPLFGKILKVLKNKYILATFVFVVIICFIDENNLMVTFKLRNEVNGLKREEALLHEGIVNDSIEAYALKYDQEAIERYGRERYFMKCKDEDIYIIKRK